MDGGGVDFKLLQISAFNYLCLCSIVEFFFHFVSLADFSKRKEGLCKNNGANNKEKPIIRSMILAFQKCNKARESDCRFLILIK